MSETGVDGSPSGVSGLVEDWASDKQAYNVPWGKAMMWIFLVSDTFIFTCFLTGYLNVRLTTTEPWPLQTEIFALTLFGQSVPLVLIAIMTFIRLNGVGCQLWIPQRQNKNILADGYNRFAGGFLRWDASVRVDQAHSRRCPTVD